MLSREEKPPRALLPLDPQLQVVFPLHSNVSCLEAA